MFAVFARGCRSNGQCFLQASVHPKNEIRRAHSEDFAPAGPPKHSLRRANTEDFARASFNRSFDSVVPKINASDSRSNINITKDTSTELRIQVTAQFTLDLFCVCCFCICFWSAKCFFIRFPLFFFRESEVTKSKKRKSAETQFRGPGTNTLYRNSKTQNKSSVNYSSTRISCTRIFCVLDNTQKNIVSGPARPSAGVNDYQQRQPEYHKFVSIHFFIFILFKCA